MRLTVITPTVGRDSLRATLASIAPQLHDGDEHIVIGDGVQPRAAEMCAEYGAIYHDGPQTHDYGAAQRDVGMALAQGDWLLFCDDDDTFTPGALATVRQVVVDNPTMPHLFRMRYRASGVVLWQDDVVCEGNVGTPMIVVPTCLELPAWSDGHPVAYTSDHRFIQRVTDLYGVVWRKEIICIVR